MTDDIFEKKAAEALWLTQHPQFQEKPATILEFLGPGYLNIEKGVRPGIKKALIAVFGEEVQTDRIAIYEKAMLTGAIGIGKSTFASIALPYMVHWVLCLRDPQDFFSLLPGSRIAFMMMSTSETQARNVIFSDIFARIEHSKWFSEKYPYDKNYKKQIKFPQKDVNILPGDSRETTFEGYNIMGGILDEMDSHTVTKEKDYADVGYDTIEGRMRSRFGHRGLLIPIGQMKKATGFAARKYAEFMIDPDAYVVRMTLWESLGWDWKGDDPRHPYPFLNEDGSHKSFYFDYKRRMFIPKGVGDLLPESDTILEIPEYYRRDFENKPEKSLKDLAGIPPKVSDPFISRIDKIEDCRTRWIARKFPDDEIPESVSELAQFSPVTESSSRPEFRDWFTNARINDQRRRVIHIDVAYCVDEKTQILTQRGWLNYRSVKVGDLTLAIDKKTHLAKWEPITAVNIFPKQKRKMLSIEHESISALSTADHRWYVQSRKWDNSSRSYSGREPKVVRSYELNEKHSIVTSAPVLNLPSEPKFLDALVEIVAWFWTEGSIYKLRSGKLGNSVTFCQSTTVNMANCKRIEAALIELFGEPVDSFGRNGASEGAKPMWKYSTRNNGKREYYLNTVAGKIVLAHCPNKIVTNEFIFALTRAQLELFSHVSMLADRSSDRMIAQKDGRRLEALRICWILLGYRTNEGTSVFSGMDWISRISRPYLKISKFDKQWVEYDGEVWCPTTPSGSWLARRDGTVYYTGNSADGDALGMAMGHIVELREDDGEDAKPIFCFDFLLRVKAAAGTEILLGDIRRIIYYLRDDLKFRITKVTYDGFESTDSIQQLRKKRFDAEKVSMDKSTLPYEDLRDAIYEDRVEFPPYITELRKGETDKMVEIAVKELSELQDTGKKVDHPVLGSKDVADTMAGVVHELIGDRRYRRGVSFIDVARKKREAERLGQKTGTDDVLQSLIDSKVGNIWGQQVPKIPNTLSDGGLVIPSHLRRGPQR